MVLDSFISENIVIKLQIICNYRLTVSFHDKTNILSMYIYCVFANYKFNGSEFITALIITISYNIVIINLSLLGFSQMLAIFFFYFEGFTSFPTALTANDRNRRIQVYQASDG